MFPVLVVEQTDSDRHMTVFPIYWDSQIFYTHPWGSAVFSESTLASFYQLLLHQKRKQAWLRSIQTLLQISVIYLQTPLAGHPKPNPRIHTKNEYMMNHPQQLLALFLFHVWKIKKICYTVNYKGLIQHSYMIWQMSFCDFLSSGWLHATWLIQQVSFACNITEKLCLYCQHQ